VLTRQDQLACKKKGKTPTEAEEDPGNTEPGDVEQHKRGTRAPKSKGKGKAKGEAKKKASPKKRGRKPKTEKAGEEKEELKAPKAAPKRKKSEAVEEPVNCNLFHGEEPEEELAEDDPAVEDSDEEPPVMKRPASKRTRTKSAQSTGATHGSDDSDEDVKPKAKANATGKRKAGPKKIPKAESKRKAKAKAKAKSRPQPVENVAAMEDDTMKGVFLQHMKEVKDCTYDDLKEVLNSKKVECKVTKGCLRFNIYWTRCSGAASLCLQPPKWVDAASFAFKAGTWNMRMSAAFTCVWLMVACLIFQICFFFLGMKWAYKITKPQFQKGKCFLTGSGSLPNPVCYLRSNGWIQLRWRSWKPISIPPAHSRWSWRRLSSMPSVLSMS